MTNLIKFDIIVPVIKMIIGSHVNFGSDQLLGSVKQALSYGANTLMFYTGAPQNTMRKSLNEDLILESHQLMKDNNIDISNVICHAPYIVNLANNKDEDKWQFSISFLKQELSRCKTLGIKYMVLHPGSAVGLDRNIALNNIVDALNFIIEDNSVMILLETMAGKGTECGCTLEEIKYILDGVKSNNIGVCIDTCHLNDAGYDMSKFDEFLDLFDKIIGIDKIKCVHLNDSKNILGARKDRHENIGYGTIGFENLVSIAHNERLKDIPKILETPWINKEYAPYKEEIEMLKTKIFDSKLKDKA